MMHILITGLNSYIGNNVENWFNQYPSKYKLDLISVRDDSWKVRDFSKYDVVLHAAGIAHTDVGSVSEDKKQLYFKVNRDLTIEVAKKAKREGVRQFIYLSSIIVYGIDSSVGKKRIISKDTVPNPSNFYGKSKLEAEEGILPLDDEHFKVVILRPPMIYGKGSKGNYPVLSKIARKTIVFPNIENERSMLFIDNLCEFIRHIVDNEERGIYFPQNEEYVKTADLVKRIAEIHGKRVKFTSILNVGLGIAACIPGKIGELVNKAFGNLVYDKRLSYYDKGSYHVRSFEESVKLTEGGE